MKGPSLLSLFAGAGGLTLGLERAGFVSVGAVEIDEQAGEAFRRNFHTRMPTEDLLALGPGKGDITTLDFEDQARRFHRLGLGRLDLIAGGSPCQAFSRVGRGKLNDIKRGGFRSDSRNELWKHFFRAVAAFRPKVFLFENVPGMLHHGGRNMAEVVCREGTAHGYRVCCAILNSAAFGVPQIRERLFILGISGELGIAPTLPTGDRSMPLSRGHLGAHPLQAGLFEDVGVFLGTLLPECPSGVAVTTHEALGDLPPFHAHLESDYRARLPCDPVPYRPVRPSAYARLMRSWEGFASPGVVTDHICKATPRDYETFALMRPGDRYPDAVKWATKRHDQALSRWRSGLRPGPRPRREDFIPPYRDDTFPEKWRKLIPNEPAWTLTAHLAKDTYSHIHYDSSQARMITVREAARLQSFPDGFQFVGNIGDRFRQIGNSVPPLLAFGVGAHLISLMENTPRKPVARRNARALAPRSLAWPM